MGGLLSIPHSWERSAERSVLPYGMGGWGGCRYREELLFSVCRVTVSPHRSCRHTANPPPRLVCY